MKDIVLFDMDGTLTEPRKKIGKPMVEKLLELSRHADIGIVTGSNYDYLIEQCKDIWETVSPLSITLLPCNGTQVYRWSPSLKVWQHAHSVNMIKEIGRLKYSVILRACFKYQKSILEFHDLPYTGTFLHYRGSMLNWCPIGRNAKDHQRNAWIEEDTKHNIRTRFHKHILRDIKTAEIPVEVTLGGSTSFDIYPTGWDKTYCLRHFDNMIHWFVGDSCTGTGNDRTLYEAVSENSRGFITESPERTIKIIDKIIDTIENKENQDVEEKSDEMGS